MKTIDHNIRYFIFGGIFLAMILFSAPPSRPALACEPTAVIPGYVPPTPIPLETQVAGASQSAEIVLEGIIESWVAGPGMDSILTVQVERYLKGHGPKTVKIQGYFWICAPNFAFSEGSRATFFLNGDASSAEPLQSQSWYDVQEAVAAGVRNSTGQRPAAPNGTYNIVWLSLFVTVLLGWGMFIRYRRNISNAEKHEE